MSTGTPTPRGRKRRPDGLSERPPKRTGLTQSQLTDYLNGHGSNNIYSPLIDAPEDVAKSTKESLKHLPPIKIVQKLLDSKTFKEEVRKWVTGKIHFRVAKDSTEILTYSVEDHKTVQCKLKAAKIQFFSFTPASEISKKLVIKGIDKNYSVDEVLTDLQQQLQENDITVIKVVPLVNKKGQSSDANPCLVYFNSNTNVNFVTRVVRYCCSHRIKWEHFRKQLRAGIQCRNCQRMGHVAKNCGLPYRCVKCTQQHLPGECNKQTNDKPVCVNCGKFHTSNWRGCDVIKKYQESKINTAKPKILPTVTTTTAYNSQRKPSRTYCDVARQSTVQNSQLLANIKPTSSQSDFNSFTFLQTEVLNLFNVSLTELLQKIREFLPSYQAAVDISSKQVVLLSFLFSVVK